VIKGVLTDRGFANAVLAQQVYGGHGYIVEHGMEQFVRDARIAMLYEGANGIQALDLVGRKLGKDDGRAVQALFAEMRDFIKQHGDDAMQPYVAPFAAALAHLREATLWLMQSGPARPDDAGAAATDYMHLMGLVVLAYMWCRIVAAVIAPASAAKDRRAAKLATARFFMERILPETALRLARMKVGAASVMGLPPEEF
jgi:hypothetical protein